MAADAEKTPTQRLDELFCPKKEDGQSTEGCDTSSITPIERSNIPNTPSKKRKIPPADSSSESDAMDDRKLPAIPILPRVVGGLPPLAMNSPSRAVNRSFLHGETGNSARTNSASSSATASESRWRGIPVILHDLETLREELRQAQSSQDPIWIDFVKAGMERLERELDNTFVSSEVGNNLEEGSAAINASRNTAQILSDCRNVYRDFSNAKANGDKITKAYTIAGISSYIRELRKPTQVFLRELW